jgi:drug/metabolite transporter (DMT)-like permease
LAGVSVGGAAVLALGGSAAGRDPTITGDLLAVGGAVAVGMYIILGRWARRSVTAITYSLVVYGIAAAVLVGTAAAVGRPLWPYPAREFVLFFLLALLCTILGHSLISYGLKEVPAGEVSMMILLEPIFATIMAAIWLNELPGIVSVAGAIIVLGALLEATRTDRALN